MQIGIVDLEVIVDAMVAFVESLWPAIFQFISSLFSQVWIYEIVSLILAYIAISHIYAHITDTRSVKDAVDDE